MKFILGKKIEMTQIWKDGQLTAVTRVKAGPCIVVQKKNKEKDGYEALQIGFGEKKEKNIKKPQKGHLEKLKSSSNSADRQNSNLKTNVRYLKEFRLNQNIPIVETGDIINVTTFEPGNIIKVTGTSKGKGFQGVVKRHGFKGAPKSHGTKDQLRMPGSSGATEPQHVFKGVRKPGHTGDDKVSIKNLEIIEVDKDNNELLIKGGVPGARHGLLIIQGEGDLKLVKPEIKKEEITMETEEPKKETKEEIQKEPSNHVGDSKVEVSGAVKPEENIEQVVIEAKEKIDKENT